MTRKLLTLKGLIETAQTFPAEFRQSKTHLHWGLASCILKYYLGHAWLMTNIYQDDKGSLPDGFLRMNYTAEGPRELKTARVVELAEMIFNLQHVPGFEGRMTQLQSGQFEGTFAELDSARFLYMHEINFEFVVPTGVKGSDYDYAITFADGRVACADTKCRIEGRDLRPETIEGTLNHARRKNLPKDKPGMIFLKIPPAATEIPANRSAIPLIVNKFLASTERIVSVVVYSTRTAFVAEEEMIKHLHRFDEFPNKKHRFDTTLNWRIFVEGSVQKRWTGLPEKWTQIFSINLDSYGKRQ